MTNKELQDRLSCYPDDTMICITIFDNNQIELNHVFCAEADITIRGIVKKQMVILLENNI